MPATTQSRGRGLTAFTWGYWGWGNSVRQLLKVTDAAEAARGFAPPIFVDIRLRRVVRAPGFREAAFERVVGADRYLWMPGLGNAKIALHEAGVSIADPKEADHLLGVICEHASSGRRVIYFCACEVVREWPCHRHTVTRLLLRAAKRRGTPLTVEEWPGGDIGPDPVIVKDPMWTPNGSRAIRLGTRLPAGPVAWLPWGTPVAVKTRRVTHFVLSGPAQYRKHWSLPALWYLGEGEWKAGYLARARAFRRSYACGPRSLRDAGRMGRS